MLYLQCLAVLAYMTTIFASPTLWKRYDLDCNGVPDECSIDSSGNAQCILSNGLTTTFATATYIASCTSSTSTSTAAPSSTTAVRSAASSAASATLPSPSQFALDNGTKWTITYVGDLGFTGTLRDQSLGGDKCRSSTLGDQVLWNCGDMMCGSSVFTCGFSMGPSFYGTDSVMFVNASAFTNIGDDVFVSAWSGDPAPESPQTAWGMDTSNIAAVNSTTGITFAWEIWRGAADGSYVDRGNAVSAVTLGATKPIATRIGPLLTGPSAIQLGLIAIYSSNKDDYIYIYSEGGSSGIIIGRVPKTNDAAFDASQYEFLETPSSATASPVWSNTGSSAEYIPCSNSTTYSAYTASGSFACLVYGSVFYNTYLERYVIVCNIYMSQVNMYTAPNPWGPWSETYTLLSDWNGYGSHVHDAYGSGSEFYFSLGPDSVFNMFKVQLEY